MPLLLSSTYPIKKCHEMSSRFNMWVPSPPRSVIGPAAYYPFADGGVMKAPLSSLIVAGLFWVFWVFNFFFRVFYVLSTFI